MGFPTAADILNDVAVELGLISADITNPYGSTNPNIIQLCRLLKRLGRRLCGAKDWTHLKKEHTFATVASTASYALPTDFARIVDASEWNRTTTQELRGPVESQEWQALKAGVATSGIRYNFRIWQNLFWLDPTPSAVENIYYEYISNKWVMPTGETAPTTTLPTVGADTLWFDEDLLVAGLKLLWREAKGQDNTAVLADFRDAWAIAAGGDGAKPILSLNGRPSALPWRSRLPDTGWGT